MIKFSVLQKSGFKNRYIIIQEVNIGNYNNKKRKFSRAGITLSVFILLFFSQSYSQINIFERKSQDPRNNETIFTSETRPKIDLNGMWSADFGRSGKYTSVTVPFCADYKGEINVKRDFKISDTLLSKYSFIFYAEGINYESEVTLNNVIISRNSGGGRFIFSDIQENLLQASNTISIKISGGLNNYKSFPLAAQSSYALNFTGITGNIYILAVPKIYISETLTSTTFTEGSAFTLKNSVSINTYYLDTLMLNENGFSIRTEIYRMQDSAKVFESPAVKINAKNYQNYKVSNSVQIKGAELWSAENPQLYLIKTCIYYNDELIDNVVYETGFRKTEIQGNTFYINGESLNIRGVNYFEDQPMHGSALEYAATERDLRNIKDLGFNTIRVPGKTAHPFVVKIAQRLGLNVLQEYPFNEVPSRLLADENFVNEGIDYLENVIRRDMHSPAVLAWGAGNDFDVTKEVSAKYAASIKEAAAMLDSRPLYYTSRNLNNDKVMPVLGIKGLNVYERDFNTAKETLDKMNEKDFSFISSFGVSADNNNRNGFGDLRSSEYQAKYVTEIASSKNAGKGYVISSYADYTADSPLMLHYERSNPRLRTDGIFDYARNQKYSYSIIKRMLNNQGFQKIPEGSVSFAHSRSSNYFIVIGLAVFILLLFAFSRIRYFKDNALKCIMTPRNFLYTVKEQNDIPNSQSLIMLFFLSSILSLLFSSIVYSLRYTRSFEMIFSKLVENDTLKYITIEFINNPLYLFLGLFVKITALFLFTYLLANLALKFIKGKSVMRPLFALSVWSFVILIIFLPFGIVFSKTMDTESYTIIYFTMIGYGLALLYSLFKFINGIKYVFEIGAVKSYFYGILITALIIFMNYYYFFILKSSGDFINLIRSYR